MQQQSTVKKPIKRHLVLQPLSHDHHHTLLLVWKIRTGLKKGIDPERIKQYVDWFYQTYIITHFELEEQYVYSVLDTQDIFSVQAFDEHTVLRALFQTKNSNKASLSALADKLEAHIRFEERSMFNRIESVASKEDWELMSAKIPKQKFSDNETDKFWV